MTLGIIDMFKPMIANRLAALAAMTAILVGTSSLSAQVIHVKSQVNADHGQNLRLGDVATITGIDAKAGESLLNMIIIPGVNESRALRAEAILMAVISQIGPGKLADSLQVQGAAACDIQFAGTAPKVAAAKPLARLAPATPAAPPQQPPVAAAFVTPARAKTAVHQEPKNTSPTLAKLVISHIQEELAVSPDDLRISFDSVNPLLDQQAPIGRRWVFRTLSRSLLGTIQLEAQLLEESRIVQKTNLQVQVLKRQRVLVATTTIARGEVVTPSTFRSDEIWLDRSMPTLLVAEKDVVGLEAKRDVAAGSNLDERDFRPVAMASKGDVVSVVFLHGSMKVQMKGRAASEGKLHDTIQVKNEATNELYDAVLIGKRLAVVGGTLTEAQEKQIREAK
jgi:flagella basal body P-ring formation protein FlgA